EGVKTVEISGHRCLVVRVFGLENHDVDAFPAEQGAGPLGAGRDFDDAAAVAQVNAAFNGAGAGELDDVQPVAQEDVAENVAALDQRQGTIRVPGVFQADGYSRYTGGLIRRRFRRFEDDTAERTTFHVDDDDVAQGRFGIAGADQHADGRCALGHAYTHNRAVVDEHEFRFGAVLPVDGAEPDAHGRRRVHGDNGARVQQGKFAALGHD